MKVVNEFFTHPNPLIHHKYAKKEVGYLSVLVFFMYVFLIATLRSNMSRVKEDIGHFRVLVRWVGSLC